MSVNVSIEKFEGPLALLLYLIRKEEMNIYDIPIHRITQEYLDHIKLMRELDLEVASEFITMAATLIHIKSKMLLPQHEGENGEEPEDPRKELVLRLLEYQKYQDGAQKLNQRSVLGRDIFARGIREDLTFVEDGSDIELEEKGLYNMISMYRYLIRNLERRVHKVMVKAQSIASRILELRDYLVPGQCVTLKNLIQPFDMARTKVVVTFLSLLELTKIGFTQLFQNEPYSDIYVETLKVVDRNVIERVDDYDATQAMQVQTTLGLNQVQLTDEDLVDTEAPVPVATAETETEFENYEGAEVASDDDILNAEQELGILDVSGEPEPGMA